MSIGVIESDQGEVGRLGDGKEGVLIVGMEDVGK
jgi:hypothetical protein